MTKAADLALGKIAAVKTALIEFTDGDDAIAVADAGVVTLLTTAVVKSEGGAVTTNVTNGLAKAHMTYDMSGTVNIVHGFNLGSAVDVAQGKFGCSFINNMATATEYAAAGICKGNGFMVHGALQTASAMQIWNHDWDGDLTDFDLYGLVVHGDLA
mgnify:CR=1 FL=1